MNPAGALAAEGPEVCCGPRGRDTERRLPEQTADGDVLRPRGESKLGLVGKSESPRPERSASSKRADAAGRPAVDADPSGPSVAAGASLKP